MLRTQVIEEQLNQALDPIYISVQDESHNHHVPQGAQTHFKVIVVSKHFEGLKPVKRHQLVYKILEGEFSSGLHALSLHLYTLEEWKQRAAVLDSPFCKDGYKHKKEET